MGDGRSDWDRGHDMGDLTEREAEATGSDRGTVPEGRYRSLILPVLAFAMLVVFLGILAFWVPRLDLVVWIAFTVGLVAVDFFVFRAR